MKSKTLLFILLLTAQGSYAQDCKTLAANKAAVLASAKDEVDSPTGKMSSVEMAKMKPYLAKAENWTKKILTNFTGAKLLYYNNFFPDYLNDGTTHKDFTRATGVKSYCNSKMMFFAYYCYDNSSSMHTEAESGSGIDITFNNFFTAGFTSDAGVQNIEGKPIFRIIQKKRSEGRIDFYEQRVKDNASAKIYTANDYILLRNSDKPVFIPVTRKEYLQQMLMEIENSGTQDAKLMAESYLQNAKQFEAEMKIYKTMDKSYTPEKEAKRRKWFEEDQEKLKKNISKINPGKEAAKATTLQYLKKPDEWLSKGFSNIYPYSTYTSANIVQYAEDMDKAYQDESEQTQEEVVTVNPAYYNKTLTSDVPQLIMLHLRNGSYAHMEKAAAMVKKPGALAGLDAILNGKSAISETAPSIITSNYKLIFLPKLNTLTSFAVPADMPASTVPGVVFNNPPVVKLNIETPAASFKLKGLPVQPLTTTAYNKYLQELSFKISGTIRADERKKADDYLISKKITQSKDMSTAALAAWLQSSPRSSLYLYSKALTINPADTLAANNFAAFLIMAGLPEKAIPVLQYWNTQYPNQPATLVNLGNACYQLGDITAAMKHLQQAVLKDSLNATANKILCIMYMKQGDVKKAEEHGSRSISTSHDEQVINILRQLNNKTKPGSIMSRFPPLPVNEFPLLKRIQLPAMPASLDEMEQFEIELNALKESLQITIEDIDSKTPEVNNTVQQKLLMVSLTKGISPLRIKAQYIIMDGMQTYQEEKIKTSDVFKYYLKKINTPFAAKIKSIQQKYAVQLNTLQGGEAGDEDKIAALEQAKCKELNNEIQKYLAGLSPLVNQYAQQQEYISRKFFRDYANWASWWMPETTVSFPAIERDYLKDVINILGEYKLIKKNNCAAVDPLPGKKGTLQKWEEEYCENFKGKIGIGPVKLVATCNSFGIEGGEIIVGEAEIKFTEDGVFDEFSIAAGLGAGWHTGKEGIATLGGGVSVKEFVKFGRSKTSGKWEIADFFRDSGVKFEASGEATVLNAGYEGKIIELSAAVTAGYTAGGVMAPLIPLD